MPAALSERRHHAWLLQLHRAAFHQAACLGGRQDRTLSGWCARGRVRGRRSSTAGRLLRPAPGRLRRRETARRPGRPVALQHELAAPTGRNAPADRSVPPERPHQRNHEEPGRLLDPVQRLHAHRAGARVVADANLIGAGRARTAGQRPETEHAALIARAWGRDEQLAGGDALRTHVCAGPDTVDMPRILPGRDECRWALQPRVLGSRALGPRYGSGGCDSRWRAVDDRVRRSWLLLRAAHQDRRGDGKNARFPADHSHNPPGTRYSPNRA